MAKGKQSQETQELNNLLKDVLKTQKQINEERIKDLDITRSINDEINEGLKSLSKESDFKTAILRSLKEINKLSEQNFDLSKLDLKLYSDKEDITKRQVSLSKSQNALFREQAYVDQKINTLLNDKIGATEEEKKAIDDQITSFEKVQKGLTDAVESSKQYDENLKAAAVGVDKLNKLIVPNTFAGLSNAIKDIPGLRTLAGPFEAMSKASKDTAARLTSINIQRQAAGREPMFSQAQIGLKSLSSGFSALGPVIESALGPFALIGILVKGIQEVVKLMFEADQQVTDIAKNFNISKDAARDVRNRFFELVNKAQDYTKLQSNQIVLQKELVAANIQLNNLLGTSIDYSSQLGEKGKETVVQFAAISKFLRLSEDEQKGLLDLQQTSGEYIDDIRNSVLGTTSLYKIQTGLLLNERKVLESVLTASNAIKLTIKGGNEGLTKAAIEAQKLGLSLQKVSDISKGFLDFESSISNELEAELLTGRNLNLELARSAALNGDLATVATEITKQIGSSVDFSKMNVIQQEALAKSVNMTREELADTLVTQERLNKLRGTFNALGEDQLNVLEKTGALDEATIKNIRDNKGTVVDYYNALKAAGKSQKEIIDLLGNQAAISLSSQSAQEKFNDSLEKAKETFTNFIDGGSLDKFADFLDSIVNEGLIKTLFLGVKSKYTNPEEEYNKQVKKGDVTLLTQQAVNQAQNNEITTVGAEPKMASGGIVTTPTRALIGEAGPEAVIPLNQLMGEFKEMKQILVAILNKEGTITLNGTKMGTAMAVGSYKVQ